jgi:hypothetical protein
MADDGFASTGPVTWLDAPPDVDDSTVAVVTEALLPVFVVPAAVQQAVEQKLSTVERFLVEVAVQLGDLTATDVEELVGLPAEATHRIAGHLSTTRILEPVGDGYVVRPEAAREALDREVVVELHDKNLTFVVLPVTGDVLAYEHQPRRPKPPMVDGLEPVGRVPVPAGLRGVGWAEVLGDKIRAGKVGGLPDGVVDIAESWRGEPVPDTCPTYRCTGVVRRRGDRLSATMRLYGDRGERFERVDLTAASGVVEYWQGHADLLAQPEWVPAVRRAAGLPPPDEATEATLAVEQRGPAEWALLVDGDGARAAADAGRRLSRPGGLKVVGPDGTTKTEVVVRFAPRVHDAALVFAVEGAVDEIIERADPSAPALSPMSMSDAVEAASQATGVAPETVAAGKVVRRLWQRRPHVVYQLRAAEDFAYA